MTTHPSTRAVSRRAALAGLGAGGLGLALPSRGLSTTAQEATPVATPTTAPGQFATVNGAELYYEVRGPDDAPVVQLLHGSLGSVEDFDSLVPALLAAGYRTLAFDARARGRSTWGDLPPTIAQGALDAVGLLDSLGIARADVVGWSWGANVAMELAIHHAARVGRVVEYGGAYSSDCCYAELHVTDQLPPFEVYTFPYQRLSPAPERLEEFLAVDAANPQSFSEADLESITVPVLVLDGAESEFTKPEHITQLAELIPGAELVLMPGTGHFAPRALPGLFNPIVVDFLTGETVGTPTAATPSA
jgi:pimeloyl-ACP methyl ester carboxylesterase